MARAESNTFKATRKSAASTQPKKTTATGAPQDGRPISTPTGKKTTSVATPLKITGEPATRKTAATGAPQDGRPISTPTGKKTTSVATPLKITGEPATRKTAATGAPQDGRPISTPTGKKTTSVSTPLKITGEPATRKTAATGAPQDGRPISTPTGKKTALVTAPAAPKKKKKASATRKAKSPAKPSGVEKRVTRSATQQKKTEIPRNIRPIACLPCVKSAVAGRSRGTCIQVGKRKPCARCIKKRRGCQLLPPSVEESAAALLSTVRMVHPSKVAIRDAKQGVKDALNEISRIHDDSSDYDYDDPAHDDGNDPEQDDAVSAHSNLPSEQDDVHDLSEGNAEDDHVIATGSRERSPHREAVSNEVGERRRRVLALLSALVDEFVT